MVGGASKRGWTTWMTDVADSRVEAIVPIVPIVPIVIDVIDVINSGPSLRYHAEAYKGIELQPDEEGAYVTPVPNFKAGWSPLS